MTAGLLWLGGATHRINLRVLLDYELEVLTCSTERQRQKAEVAKERLYATAY